MYLNAFYMDSIQTNMANPPRIINYLIGIFFSLKCKMSSILRKKSRARKACTGSLISTFNGFIENIPDEDLRKKNKDYGLCFECGKKKHWV